MEFLVNSEYRVPVTYTRTSAFSCSKNSWRRFKAVYLISSNLFFPTVLRERLRRRAVRYSRVYSPNSYFLEESTFTAHLMRSFWMSRSCVFFRRESFWMIPRQFFMMKVSFFSFLRIRTKCFIICEFSTRKDLPKYSEAIELIKAIKCSLIDLLFLSIKALKSL